MSIARISATYRCTACAGWRRCSSASAGPSRPRAMLDNAPLRALLRRGSRFRRASTSHVRDGNLCARWRSTRPATQRPGGDVLPGRRPKSRPGSARAAAASAPRSASTICWRRRRFRSSSRPARIGDDFFADGSVRQIAPLSPAAAPGCAAHPGRRRRPIHGADADASTSAGAPPTRRSRRPRATRCPRSSSTTSAPTSSGCSGSTTCSSLVPRERQQRHPEIAHVDAMVIGPSRDLGAMAVPYAALAAARRALPAARPRQHRGNGRQPAVVPAVRQTLYAARCSSWVTATRWRGATRSTRSSPARRAHQPLFPPEIA